jgi:hypothetical protein
MLPKLPVDDGLRELLSGVLIRLKRVVKMAPKLFDPRDRDSCRQ